MRFVLPFTGSRGDVQPGLALALELATRGHHIDFGAPPNLVSFATAVTKSVDAISVTPFGPDTKALLESDLVRVRIKSRNPRTRLAALAELAGVGWDDMAEQLSSLAGDADAVITGTLGQEMAFNIAEAQSIPFLALHYCPVRSNGSMSVVPGRSLPTAVNRATWWLLEAMRWNSMKTRENKQRTALGLAEARSPLSRRIADHGGTEIQAYDSAFFPGLADEWGSPRPFVGFLELPSSAGSLGSARAADSALREWIAEGPPPLYFGFGSMPVRDPASLMDTITRTCEAGNHRAVVSSGWSAIDERVDRSHAVAVVGPVDHASILPMCRAAIHHGGAGTTAASIRAALPTMICWFSADQPFWGAALTRTGAGHSIAFSRLDSDTLTHGLDILLTPDTAARASRLAKSMTAPADAVRAAADLAETAVHQNR